MEKLEFACLLDHIQKYLNLKLDSDIVSHIYDKYCETYDNYGLFELYGAIKKKNVKIDTNMMKWETLMDMIKTQKLDVPPKNIMEGFTEPIWYLMRDKDNVFSITLTYPKFEINKYDVITMSDGFTYEINEIYLLDEELYSSDDDDAIRNDCQICLQNLDTGEYSDITGKDFLYKLDFEEGVQFVISNWLDYMNK
jgi:hypothetical protein